MRKPCLTSSITCYPRCPGLRHHHHRCRHHRHLLVHLFCLSQSKAISCYLISETLFKKTIFTLCEPKKMDDFLPCLAINSFQNLNYIFSKLSFNLKCLDRMLVQVTECFKQKILYSFLLNHVKIRSD